MSELAFKNKVVKFIKKNFPEVWFFKASDRFTSGIPDIIGCMNGRYFALELKFGKGKSTKLQNHVISEIKKAGGHVMVVYELSEVRMFLTALQIITKGGFTNV